MFSVVVIRRMFFERNTNTFSNLIIIIKMKKPASCCQVETRANSSFEVKTCGLTRSTFDVTL